MRYISTRYSIFTSELTKYIVRDRQMTTGRNMRWVAQGYGRRHCFCQSRRSLGRAVADRLGRSVRGCQASQLVATCPGSLAALLQGCELYRRTFGRGHRKRCPLFVRIRLCAPLPTQGALRSREPVPDECQHKTGSGILELPLHRALNRSPERRGISDGATTAQLYPAAVTCR